MLPTRIQTLYPTQTPLILSPPARSHLVQNPTQVRLAQAPPLQAGPGHETGTRGDASLAAEATVKPVTTGNREHLLPMTGVECGTFKECIDRKGI